jgi:glucose-6-phosphate isomerase/transaldolase/glucose-6-phosphate isomerase
MAQRTGQSVSLGEQADAVADALARLEREDIVNRVWTEDHTVWRDDPTELSDRLGWLTVVTEMRKQVADLNQFSAKIKDSGFSNIALLGMGGSSLGPEVIGQTFGSIGGYPQLTVLDSTVPSAIRAVVRSIDLSRTLFIVSSKSGGTIEPNSLYRYFRDLVEEKVGKGDAGLHFVAITDPGTSLGKLAGDEGFRRTFENPPDIGGRYSVLSYFGLVPATLIGVNLERLLDHATAMATRCAGTNAITDNPGAWLGAYLAATAAAGRDKFTLVTSPRVASFGLWVEQLLAESTGKEGKGIVPVAGEPLLDARHYGDDRAFVYLRVESDDNAQADVATERFVAAGHPVVRLDLSDAYDMGAEFFRWEFATAVAGALLDIQPFDQPNVQLAKDATNKIIEEFKTVGELPESPTPELLQSILGKAAPGDYLAIMAYVQPSLGLEAAVSAVRGHVMQQHKIATTFGYGPRCLHSTGQLHKGGPNSGLFVQMTADEKEIAIPGQPFGFATLASAQALGDYQALADSGRRVIRIALGEDAEAGLLRLLGQVPAASG